MGKKLTKEEFIAKVVLKNEHVRNGDVEICGEFINTSERIECFCNIHNTKWDPIAASLFKGIGCRECAKERISEKNSKTHNEFVNELASINNDIIVTSQYRGMYEDITIQFQCGHMWTTKATNVYYKHIKCPYCSGQAVLVGFNDLYTTDPQIASLLTNSEDRYVVSRGSGQKKSFTCPLCCHAQNKYIKNVVTRGFQCSYCGDGISFPNKFGRAVLDQLLDGKYEPEYHPEWAQPYFYDNYFEYNNNRYILEMDGNFHYDDKDGFDLSLEERREIDRIKNELAASYGIIMIRIDCRESSCEYIMPNILESDLNKIFDLSNIDWEQCDMQAQKNLVKAACDIYMSGIKSIDEISSLLKVGQGAIRRYLKKGAEFGWCNYDPQIIKHSKKGGKRGIEIIVTNMKTEEQFIFANMNYCEENIFDICGIKVTRPTIKKYCNNKKPYKGFYFRFMDKTIQN